MAISAPNMHGDVVLIFDTRTLQDHFDDTPTITHTQLAKYSKSVFILKVIVSIQLKMYLDSSLKYSR